MKACHGMFCCFLCGASVLALLSTRSAPLSARPIVPVQVQRLAKTRSEGSSFCISLFEEQHVRCFSTPVGGPLSVPTFLGIGPGKSGSTSLIKTLMRHPQIACGMTTRNNISTPEVCALLKDPSPMYVDSYAQYFDQSLTGIVASGEKCPRYAATLRVPYAARALLGPRLKLLYTWRDPAELDASLYLHRWREGIVRNQTYADWSAARRQAHDEWHSCRQAQLQQIWNGSEKRSSELFLDDDQTDTNHIARQVAGFVEHDIVLQCGGGRSKYEAEPFAALLHPLSLRRWAFVFGRKQLLCVHMLDQMFKPTSTFRKVTDFLNLELFANVKADGPLGASTTLARLEAMQQQTFGEQEIPHARRALGKVNASVTKYVSGEDWKWFHEVCPRISS